MPCKYTEEEIINIISKHTGFDEENVGCWYNNLYSNECTALGGVGCKKYHICKNLEKRFVNGDW